MPLCRNETVRIILQERPKLLAFIVAIVRDRHLAEDVYQEVSINALDQGDKIQDADHLKRWLRQVARNQAINAYRKKKSGRVVFNDALIQTLEEEWAGYDEIGTSQTLIALESCLEQLSPYARRLVELRYTEGLTGDKLAQVVNRKTTTVYVAISRIHRALGNCIRKYREEDSVA